MLKHCTTKNTSKEKTISDQVALCVVTNKTQTDGTSGDFPLSNTVIIFSWLAVPYWTIFTI